eukprot:CAMPEP_0119561356 /NCGR_PEP_ID=MMETSP1352-20130426/17320_1 /TAXON_ID=265584 /ORGANISM="Stauroneis constricta, Strain CCMP1120" /LENGTH=63 /DNA_ID=CAMNT_0007609535 /DNA_START=21 /DNA_END=209 /DNA_ORIENTATION=+
MDVAANNQASILSDDPIATRNNAIVFSSNQHHDYDQYQDHPQSHYQHQHSHGNMRGLQTTGTP